MGKSRGVRDRLIADKGRSLPLQDGHHEIYTFFVLLLLILPNERLCLANWHAASEPQGIEGEWRLPSPKYLGKFEKTHIR